MANTKETGKKLRQRFAADKPQLIARAECAAVKMEPMVKVYANQNVLASGNDVNIPAFAYDKASAKSMYPAVLSKGETENVKVDQLKINRMRSVSPNFSQKEYS